MQYDLLNILTPFFNEIGWKMRECRPKNDFRGGGLRGGHEKCFYANFDGFKSYLDHFWVLTYGLGVNKSISAVKITIHRFVSLKSSSFVQNLVMVALFILRSHAYQNYNFIVGSPKSVKNYAPDKISALYDIL